jgi:hypothetical protein
MQERFDAIRLVLFGRDYEDNASSFAVRFPGKGADAAPPRQMFPKLTSLERN